MGSKLTDLADLAPSGDFTLNAFLLELNDDLTDEDLEKLKFLCSGKYGLSKRALERVEKPIDLFKILREKELLNEMNIITLQALLWTLPRKDLQKKYVEFAESLGSSVHFVLPRDTPENGYKYLKFHIVGTDLETYQKPELEKLRSMIASLLRVPPEFVIVSGIEPSNSLLITIMVLEDDAQRMSTLPLASLTVLSEMFVNSVMVNEKQILISGDAKQTNGIFQTNSRMEEEARKALCRQIQAERELEKAHDKISKLQSELASAQSRQESNFRLSYMVVFLIQCCHDVYNKVIELNKSLEASALHPVDKLQKLCVLTVFRHRLRRVRELGYNEEVIYDLLDAQANVFQWHKHEMKDIEIARLKTEIAYIAWEREKLAFYHGLGVQDKVMSQRDEFCLTALVQNIPINIQHNITINTQSVRIECVEYAFRRLGKDVTDSELKILNEMNKSQGKKFSSVYHYLINTLNKRKEGVELGSFVNDVLVTPLKRPDLLEKLDRYVLEFPTSSGKPQPSGSTKKSGRRKCRPTAVTRRGKPTFSSKTGTGLSSANEPQQDPLQEILKKLNKIENNLERRELNPYTKYNNDSTLDMMGQLFPPSFKNGHYNLLNPVEETKIC